MEILPTILNTLPIELVDNWEHNLEDLGFSKRKKEVDLYITVEQISCIINVDNSCLSIDVSNGKRGGRPEAVF